MDHSIFNLNTRTVKYRLHPVAVTEILNHHERRKNQTRVFGLLVGKKHRTMYEVTEALNIYCQISSTEGNEKNTEPTEPEVQTKSLKKKDRLT